MVASYKQFSRLLLAISFAAITINTQANENSKNRFERRLKAQTVETKHEVENSDKEIVHEELDKDQPQKRNPTKDLKKETKIKIPSFKNFDEVKTQIDEIIEKVECDSAKTRAIKNNILKPNNTFTESELSESIGTILELCKPSFTTQDTTTLRTAQSFLSKMLSDYKVSGVAFAFDPNGAFIYDSQNPEFSVCYKNNEGKIRSRKYQAKIQSWGLKFAFTLNFNLIFFTNADFNFENSDKDIQLGTGIDLSASFPIPGTKAVMQIGDLDIPYHKWHTPSLNFTYAPFKNAPGGMIMVGTNLYLGLASPGLSIVTGGSLKPVLTD